MGRIQRPNLWVQQILTTAIGSSDATTLFDIIVPGDYATLVAVVATQKTAGATTGTFSIQIMAGAADAANVAIGDASSGTFIDADAVAGTVHGLFKPNGRAVSDAMGQHIGIKTVKTGTVSTGAVLLLQLFWQL
jgi:hypothetical protein